MSRCQIDHLAITAPSLEAGAKYLRQTLAVEPQVGGRHPRMGTHNMLVRLGDSLFLEVIAPDPDAPAPGRPRWFGLDRLRHDSLPALSVWVVRTTDIQAAASGCCESLGEIESMNRGALTWQITVPADGSIPLDGVGPALIEWHAQKHPAAALQEQGLSLARLDIYHPEPARITGLLASLDFEGPVSVKPLPRGALAHLVATIRTPQGLRELSVPNLAVAPT